MKTTLIKNGEKKVIDRSIRYYTSRHRIVGRISKRWMRQNEENEPAFSLILEGGRRQNKNDRLLENTGQNGFYAKAENYKGRRENTQRRGTDTH